MHEARTIAVNGAELNVCDVGRGPAILFLHGNTSRWQHWEPQLRAFAGRYRCVAFDQRGFGRTVAPPGTSLAQLAADAAALCGALGIARAYAVGLSMGGAVAEVLVLRHPALVAAIVTAAPPILPVPPGGSGRPKPTHDDVRAMLERSFGGAMRREQPEVTARLIAECLETDLTVIDRFATDDVADFDPARIAAPTLVIAGSEDQLAPAPPLRALAGALPRGEWVEIAGSGHWLNVEQPGVFNAAVEAFFARHPLL